MFYLLLQCRECQLRQLWGNEKEGPTEQLGTESFVTCFTITNPFGEQLLCVWHCPKVVHICYLTAASQVIHHEHLIDKLKSIEVRNFPKVV